MRERAAAPEAFSAGSQLTALCTRVEAFEMKVIRWIAVDETFRHHRRRGGGAGVSGGSLVTSLEGSQVSLDYDSKSNLVSTSQPATGAQWEFVYSNPNDPAANGDADRVLRVLGKRLEKYGLSESLWTLGKTIDN